MTKRFQFRLERIRQLKASVAEEKFRELGKAVAVLREAEAYLEALFSAWGEEKPIGGTIEGFVIDTQFRARMKETVAQQRQKVEEERAAVEAARASYIEAKKEAEIFEKLKSKASEEYRQELNREEGIFLDELAVQRAGLRERMK